MGREHCVVIKQMKMLKSIVSVAKRMLEKRKKNVILKATSETTNITRQYIIY